MIKKALLSFLLLFVGCKEIYTKIYDERLAKEPISCLKISSDNLVVENIVKKSQFFKKLYKKECPYALKIDSNFIQACSLAKIKAFGSDFDGYVRFEILKDSHLIYRNQRDFKGLFNQKIANSLIDRLKKDLKFKEQ